MPLKAIRARHVYVASAAAFVALAGFEGARMAAGHDPALAATRHVRPAPTAQPFVDPNDPQGGFDPGPQGGGDPGDQGGLDPGPQGGGDPGDQGGSAGPGDGGQVPQPESRLS
jgi:hypothetical protein